MPARLIYLLGVDGSGKTTVAEHVERHLRAENRSVRRVWATFHPVFLVPIIKVAKFLFVRKHSKFDDYSEHMKAKNKAVRRFHFLLKPLLYLSLLEYYSQYLWKVVRMGWKNDYLICDRYYIDMIMERAILVGAGPERFSDWIRRYGRFFRTPELVLYLRTSPEVAMKRKNDIPSEEYLQVRTYYYEVVAAFLDAHVIDGDQPLSTVLARVQECINELNC